MSAFSDLPMVIEPADLAPLLSEPDLILVDLSSADQYAAGHLPGAHWVDYRRTQLGQPPAPGFLPPKDAIEAVFSELGHRSDAVYVVYDDEGGGWAGRFIWLLDVIGHGRFHYLNGGLHAWNSEGRPLTQDVPPAASKPVRLTLDDAPTATLDDVLDHLDKRDRVIWDARGPLEYSGEKKLAAKGGHIPGAINFEWTDGMDRARGLRIREDMAEHLKSLGITPDKEIVTHCQTHHRSGFTYLVARALGYPRVKAYAGSWSEWGNHPATPVEP